MTTLIVLSALYIAWGIFRERIRERIRRLFGQSDAELITPKDSATSYLSSAPISLLPFSLATANLTVAGGIVALISATDIYGLYTLALPITAGAGIFVFYFMARSVAKKNMDDPLNLLKINDAIGGSTEQRSTFLALYSFSVILINSAFLGWELYVGSELLLGYLDMPQTFTSHVFLASGLCLTIFIYSFSAGYTSVVETDIIQAVMGIGIIIVLTYSAFSLPSEAVVTERDQLVNVVEPPWELGLVFIVSVCLVNLAYQTISPINWQISQALTSKSQRSWLYVFGLGTFILCAVWLFIIYLSLTDRSTLSYPNLLLVAKDHDWLSILFIAGVAAFLLSSADSLAIGCVNVLYNTYIGYRPPKAERVEDAEETKKKLRVAVPVFLALSLTMAFALMHTRPNIFTSLIAISGALIVFVPPLLFGAFKNHLRFADRRLSNHCIRLIFFGCVGSGVAQAFVIGGVFDLTVDQTQLATMWIVGGTFLYGVSAVAAGARKKF